MNPTKAGKQRRSARLRWQVLSWMTACAMVPLIVMAVQGYHCARQAIVSLETTHLRSVLEGRKARITDWFEERTRDLRSVAAYPCAWQGCVHSSSSPQAGESEKHCHLLDHVRSGSPSFESIAAYDTSWRRIAAARSSLHSDRELVPEAFRARLEQAAGVVVAPPHLHGSGRIGIHLGAPVTADGDAHAGFVVAAVLLSETLYPILEDNSGLRRTTKTYIVSADGHFLSGPRPHIAVLSQGTHFPKGFLEECMQEAAAYRDCCGKPVLAMASVMPQLGWTLVAEVEEEEAFAWLAALRVRAAVAASVVLVAVLLLGVGGARRVARPFHQLRDVARHVASGNHGERVSALESAEAEEVGQAFNAMLDELGDSAERLANAGSLAAVGQLSSSIVHEMRNPLSSIKLNLAAMREVFVEGSDDRELADIALREATRVEGMLNDLLAYGKPLELSLQPVALRGLLARTSDHAKAACRNRGVEVRVTWNGHEGAVVVLDEEQMLRALCNLIDNAVEFSPEQRSVALSVSVPGDGRKVAEIAVRDEGPGIPEEHLERVFEPFFTTRDRGTGLGLANVRKIVECHEGSVRAENSPEGGAVFTVCLPIARRRSE